MWLVYRTPLTMRMFVAATLGVAGVALLFLPDLAAARRDNAAERGIAYALAGTLLASTSVGLFTSPSLMNWVVSSLAAAFRSK